jgi:hypothetical protein
MYRRRLAQSIPLSLLATDVVAGVVFAINGLVHGLAVGSACACISNAVVALILGMVLRRTHPDAAIRQAALFGCGLWLTSASPFVGIFVGVLSQSVLVGALVALLTLAVGIATLVISRRR